MDILSILLLILIGGWVIVAIRHIVKSGTSCCGSGSSCSCSACGGSCKSCKKECHCTK